MRYFACFSCYDSWHIGYWVIAAEGQSAPDRLIVEKADYVFVARSQDGTAQLEFFTAQQPTPKFCFDKAMLEKICVSESVLIEWIKAGYNEDPAMEHAPIPTIQG